MKVLITGGAGYLGTELVKKLVKIPKIKEIIVYDNLSKGGYNFFLCTCIGGDNIRFVQGDILDTRKLKKELQGVDVVFNLAAKIASPYADADKLDAFVAKFVLQTGKPRHFLSAGGAPRRPVIHDQDSAAPLAQALCLALSIDQRDVHQIGC